MNRQHQDEHGSQSGPALGIDAGATLTKLAILEPDGTVRFELLDGGGDSELAARVASLKPVSIGVTGGGAQRLSDLLPTPVTPSDEFTAWARGASSLTGQEPTSGCEKTLLVSVGTGTSALFLDGASVHRVGGTALGGGTILGLGSQLCQTLDFDALCRMATTGQRNTVDFMLSDVYPEGESPLLLANDITASCFAKLAHPSVTGPEPAREDLAAAIMGLVGENIALICVGLARASDASQVFYAGSTLRGNSVLADILTTLTSALGPSAQILENGEFAGALGALEIARTRA